MRFKNKTAEFSKYKSNPNIPKNWKQVVSKSWKTLAMDSEDLLGSFIWLATKKTCHWWPVIDDKG